MCLEITLYEIHTSKVTVVSPCLQAERGRPSFLMPRPQNEQNELTNISILEVFNQHAGSSFANTHDLQYAAGYPRQDTPQFLEKLETYSCILTMKPAVLGVDVAMYVCVIETTRVFPPRWDVFGSPWLLGLSGRPLLFCSLSFDGFDSCTTTRSENR